MSNHYVHKKLLNEWVIYHLLWFISYIIIALPQRVDGAVHEFTHHRT